MLTEDVQTSAKIGVITSKLKTKNSKMKVNF